jgi:hypothetical protein
MSDYVECLISNLRSQIEDLSVRKVDKKELSDFRVKVGRESS